jgi:quercetin dioxygenase-like cupin family protein
MRNVLAFAAASLVLVAAVGAQSSAPAHILLPPADIKWGPAPPVLEKGASFALLSGDPGKPGPFAVRLKLPAGFKIAPHWHPTDEHVTVIAGTFALGMGEKFDAAAAKSLPVGGYAVLPAQMRHYALAKTAATVQVDGIGPFVLNYVNPADDPSKRVVPAPAK